jgi:hypothetical protein
MGKDSKAYGAGAAIGGMITQGSFGARLFGYFILWAVLMFFIGLWLSGGTIAHTWVAKTFSGDFVVSVLSFLAAIPFFLWEKYVVRAGRRARGLDIYKDISADIAHRDLAEKIKKEHKAAVDAGVVSDVVDKNDIGYWFSLFEKGAITKEQFEKKREELLA